MILFVTSRGLFERHVLNHIVPYMMLSFAVLVALLFALQTGRFAEFLGESRVPARLALEVAVSLVPPLLTFTVPVSVLAGTVIGLSQLNASQELVAMQAAGMSPRRIFAPVLLFAVVLSAFMFYLNMVAQPAGEYNLRRVGVQALLYKLDSPVEPRSFNTEIKGLVIYVREGDKERGTWNRVFIYGKDKTGATRIVTARQGRIDFTNDRSELVLTDAVATKLPDAEASSTANEKHTRPTTRDNISSTDFANPLDLPGASANVTERVAQMRIQIDTGRNDLLNVFKRNEVSLNELPFQDVIDRAVNPTHPDQRGARILLHKRTMLSLSPLVLAFLGCCIGLRVKRGGRELGAVFALVAFIIYYALRTAGEQMAWAGTVPVVAGIWTATFAALLAGMFLLTLKRFTLFRFTSRAIKLRQTNVDSQTDEDLTTGATAQTFGATSSRDAINVAAVSGVRISNRVHRGGARLLGFPSLLDIDLLRALFINLLLSFGALVAIYLVFSLFESWRPLASAGATPTLVGQFIISLLPAASVQLSPAGVLLAVLATYSLLARRSEAVAWWASGQSVFRLVAPGILFALLVGGGVWLVQERVMPQANRRQDALRARIGSGVARTTTALGTKWLAAPGGRLYAYELSDAPTSSDREMELVRPTIYEFDQNETHLQRIVGGREAAWTDERTMVVRDAKLLELAGGKLIEQAQSEETLEAVAAPALFKPTNDKPDYLSAPELVSHINTIAERGGTAETIAPLSVALQRKYAEPFESLVLALTGIPLALSFGRGRANARTLVLAIAVAPVFWALGGRCEQLGSYGLLPPTVAAWSPLIIFAAFGLYLLTRVRT